MRKKLLAELVTAVAAAALLAGPVPAAAPASELSGIWRGTFDQAAASLYLDQGDCVLEIRQGGTFTARATPSRARANNLSKAWTRSGKAISVGNRVTLQSSEGPSIRLVRSGKTLYGVAEDPMVEATIVMRFERGG